MRVVSASLVLFIGSLAACATGGGEAATGHPGTHHDAAGTTGDASNEDSGALDATAPADGSEHDVATSDATAPIDAETDASTATDSATLATDSSTTSTATDSASTAPDTTTSPPDTTPPPDAACCAHATTSTGAKLSRDCGACISIICLATPSCCDTSWDIPCVIAAAAAKCACK